jgi:hypothetical protein
MSPSALREPSRVAARTESPAGPAGDLVRLTLAYRAPFAWSMLLERLAADAVPGVEVVDGGRYGRTVALEGCRGLVLVEDAPAASMPARRGGQQGARTSRSICRHRFCPCACRCWRG